MLEFLYDFGSAICHQLPERSLFGGGSQFMVCSRDTGIYLGLLLGFVLVFLLKEHRTGSPNTRMLLLFILPLAVDGTSQLLGFGPSTNTVRLFTGFLFGFALSCLVVVCWNRTWLKGDESFEMPSLKGGAIAAVLGAVLTITIPRTPALFFWILNIGIFISVVVLLGSIAGIMFRIITGFRMGKTG